MVTQQRPTLLPWIALLAVPQWTREGEISAKGLNVVMV
jgi:hypothetical protein